MRFLERGREFLSPFGRTIGLAVRFERSGPRKFVICGESGGCCRSNDKVILCDLHTERDAQFVGVVVIKKGLIYQLTLRVVFSTFT